ncbi:hypothetical protein PQX77_020001 [Marasmius sp. AFHP31]|nr:hypothetical protein PQX77_020001 [Marasmius sp. AFHP31]
MDSDFNTQTAEHILLIKMVTLASFVVLIYDILLTFDDEVSYIWTPLREGKHPWLNWMTLMWCANRYLCPPAYMVVTILFHDPRMNSNKCGRYVWFPQTMRLIVTSAIGLWSRHLYATILTYFLLVAEVAVKIWAMTDVKGVYHKECTGCFVSSKKPQHLQFVYGYVAELVFDSLMLAATAVRCRQLGTKHTKFIRVIWVDSMIYLPAVFAIHLANVLLIVYASIPLKNIMTSFSSVGCTIIVSRMILNTRKAMAPEYDLTISSRPKFTTVAFRLSAQMEESEESTTQSSPSTTVKKVDLESNARYSYNSGTQTIVTLGLSGVDDSEGSMTGSSFSGTVVVDEYQKGDLGDEIGYFHDCGTQMKEGKADPTCGCCLSANAMPLSNWPEI